MSDVDVLQWVTGLFLLVVAIAWYLSYSAARLDRLHSKVEGALLSLDAQLVRRAESALELAMSGELDPSSALIVADAATASLERHTESLTTEDPLDGANFAGRELVETDLTEALNAALSAEALADVTSGESPASEAYSRLRASSMRVQMARKFHNEAVREVRRVRAKAVVRVFRLAGYASLPEAVVFDDAVSGMSDLG